MEVLYYPYPLLRNFFSMLKLVGTFKWPLVRIHTDVYRIQIRKKNEYMLAKTTPNRRKGEARKSTFICSVNSLLQRPRLPKMLLLPREPNIRHLCLHVQLLR